MKKKMVRVSILVSLAVLLVFGAFTIENVQAGSLGTSGKGYGNGTGRASGTLGNCSPTGNAENGYLGYNQSGSLIDNLPLGELSQAEKDALLYMREEEKLAHDVYTVLAEKWDLAVFERIAVSEQVHADAVLELLDRYGVADPASAKAGVFINTDLQALYDELIAKGQTSLKDALLVGGAIEEVDILDLDERLEQTDQQDIQVVFENLRKASYMHLNAFATNYQVQTGTTYQPQYMTEEEYAATQVTRGNSAMDRGAGMRAGGQGRGRGR